ncbi:G patch domain-containing protein 1 [Tyrophagus putrescentiae]|nr:G patch domain-containing protein 1 [Tyrophagus putrescentiae]
MYEDDDEEYSAPVGTAFAPLEADEIVSRKPEIDQTVRDERGRRRFHGAFTGGFSAGYWNTVGSAEGFTPQIFSSSRVNKADRQKGAKGARPEDFMDDEDFGSFGIAPKRIHTKEDFAENSSFAGLRDTSLTFDDVIKSVFAPSKQSIGMRLFQKMKRHVKMEQKARQQTLQYETKGDLHGLGYNGALDPDNFLYGDPTKALAKPEAVSATLGGGRRIKISGEAFGYGALEEEDDYMMGASVYGTDDMSQYDFALGGPAPKEKDRRKRRAGPYVCLQRCAGTTAHRRCPTTGARRGGGGRRAEGEEPKKSRWGAKVGEQTQPLTTTIESVGDSGKTPQQPTLNANLRAVILGEEVVHRMGVAKPKMPPPPPPPPPPQSKPLENQQQQQHSTTTTTASFPQKPLSGFFASRFTRGSSALDDPTISAGLSTFKDLSSTPGFEAGGQRRGGDEEEAAEEKPPTRTTYQWHPHKLVCRRFGLQHPFPQFPDVVGIVSVDRGGQKTRNMTSTLQNVKQANQLGSSSTRTLFAGLFGNMEGLASFSPAVVTADSAAEAAKNKPSSMPPPLPPPKSTQSKSTVIEVESDDENEEETEKQPRPPIDLFKSIFASDEEDDSDEEKEREEASAKPKADSAAKSAAATEKDSSNAETSEAASSNGVERRRLGGGGGGSGIFAGVDFAQLSQNFNPCLFNPCLKPQAPEPNTSLPTAAASELDDDCYGPALPPPPPPPSSSTSSKPTTVNSHLNINHHSLAGKSSSSSSTLKASSSSSHHRSSSHRSGDRDKESSSSSRSRRHKESSSKKKSKKKKSKKKSASSSSAKSSSKHHKSSSSSGSRDRKRKNDNSSSDDDDSSSRDDDDSDSEAGSNSPESKRHRKSGGDLHSIDTQILELIKAGRRQH